jgi:TM2 domain-containing membrane protein YozV
MDNLLLKGNLTGQQIAIIQGELEKNKKSKGVLYLIWFFFGGIGGHRYYLGDVGRGIAMTLTLGGFGIWSFIDVFFIGGRLREKTEKLELEIIQRVRLMSGDIAV